MTREEAKEVFLNRGYIEVDGGMIYDGNQWRKACVVISEWLKDEPKTGHWIFKHFDEETGISDSYWCSECNKPLAQVYKTYCSNCGTKMIESEGI